MVNVWTYEDMLSRTARSSPEYNPDVDLFEHPTYGPQRVPPSSLPAGTGEAYSGVPALSVSEWEERWESTFKPWAEARGWQLDDGPYGMDAYKMATGFGGTKKITAEDYYDFYLEHPLGLPSESDLARSRQVRIGRQAQGRRRTRIASLAEGSRKRGRGSRTQLAGLPGADLLGESSLHLGARTSLSGLS